MFTSLPENKSPLDRILLFAEVPVRPVLILWLLNPIDEREFVSHPVIEY
jgi:uncharacterized membrane protein